MPEPLRLPLQRAREIAVMAQQLDARRPRSLLVPVTKRRWGYDVLPILHGERIVGRADAKADRDAGVLRVPALHLEPGASDEDLAAARGELHELASWLGLGEVAVKRVVGAKVGL